MATSPTSAAHRKHRSGNAYAVEAVNRAADILFVFSHAASDLSLPEIVSLCGLPKTTTFRVLSTLCDRGLCMHDASSGKYSLGYELLHLADIRRRQATIHGLAMPVLRGIRDQVGETVVLSIRTGDYRVHIDFSEGLHSMRRMVELGRSSPLYAGAASKVLFAGLSDADIDDYLQRIPLERICDNTITEIDALKEEIAQIRKHGFAESRSEVFTGGVSLAAPVRDYTGSTIAVIDIITPDARHTEEHRERSMSCLLKGADDLSRQLGYRES